jgi:hypothetical protein
MTVRSEVCLSEVLAADSGVDCCLESLPKCSFNPLAA